MKTTLKISFSELRALHYWLMEIMAHSKELVRQSLHYRIQMEILGEVLAKKIHPKTLVDTGRPFNIKLSSVEWMAIQAAIYNGWGALLSRSLCAECGAEYFFEQAAEA